MDNCDVFGASHPVPCRDGQRAADEVIARLGAVGPNDTVVMLISGGSSALVPAPVECIDLADKILVNKMLLAGGFDIYETNLVRQALSKLKGGGVFQIVPPKQVRSYILSDVLGDDLRVVGSGPSVGPIGTVQMAKNLLVQRSLFNALPMAVQLYFNQVKSSSLPPFEHANLIAGNSNSVQAMAADCSAEVFAEPLIGDVGAAAQTIIDATKQRAGNGAFALVFGGETTVNITGSGKGGRNQELALRVALLVDKAEFDQNWCFLSGGTDGRDGPTDAAGGIVDATTLSRARAAGASLESYLADNDSYNALLAINDLFITGATGTNVADLQIMLMSGTSE